MGLAPPGSCGRGHQGLGGLGCQFSCTKRFTSVYAPTGYADRMELTQFRRRFQGLAQPEMKKFTSAYELTDEKKVRWREGWWREG